MFTFLSSLSLSLKMLIRKEWISFSHHFAERHLPTGQQATKLDAPIFLQWLDSVWQVRVLCHFVAAMPCSDFESFLAFVISTCSMMQFLANLSTPSNINCQRAAFIPPIDMTAT